MSCRPTRNDDEGCVRRRQFLSDVAAGAALLGAGARGAGAAETRDEPIDVSALHREATVFLGYMNPAIRFLPDGGMDAGLFFERTPWGQGCFPRLREGGVDVVSLSFGLNDPDLFPGRAGISRVMQSIGAFLQAAQRHADQLEIARTAADLVRIPEAGKLAVLLHLTGAFLEGNLEILNAYHAMGVRTIHPPLDTRAETCVDLWKRPTRLTEFGRRVLREMARLGMVVDLAHASDETFDEVLGMVEAPVIVSHGMCRALSDTKRNLTDAQIRAVARTGGVVGIHFAAHLIDDGYRKRQETSGFREELARWQDQMRREQKDPYQYMAHRYDWSVWERTRARQLQQSVPLPPLERIIDHVDHMVHLVGVDHVGVGTDYELGTIPCEVDRADKLPNLTRALVRRGYSAVDVKKIWGGNFLRVYRQVLPKA